MVSVLLEELWKIADALLHDVLKFSFVKPCRCAFGSVGVVVPRRCWSDVVYKFLHGVGVSVRCFGHAASSLQLGSTAKLVVNTGALAVQNGDVRPSCRFASSTVINKLL